MEFRDATLASETECLDMMYDYHQMIGLPFHEVEQSRLFEEFIHNERLGKFWIITLRSKVVGYIIFTFGYSFQHGGKDAFIDELFLKEEFRNKGLSSLIMESLAFFVKKHNVNAIHLKLDRSEKFDDKHKLFMKLGFKQTNKSLFTKLVD